MIDPRTTVILALVGPEAAGKSSHARALAASLRAQSIPATSFHHPPPPPPLCDDPFGRALWYWQQRVKVGLETRRCTPRVIVADRWWESSLAFGVVQPLDVAARMGLAVEQEIDAWTTAQFACVESILLDAPDDVLDARTVARGAEASAIDLHPRTAEMRAWYRDAAHREGWKQVDTSGPRDEVRATLLDRVLETLVGWYGWRALDVPMALDYDANGSPTT